MRRFISVLMVVLAMLLVAGVVTGSADAAKKTSDVGIINQFVEDGPSGNPLYTGLCGYWNYGREEHTDHFHKWVCNGYYDFYYVENLYGQWLFTGLVRD